MTLERETVVCLMCRSGEQEHPHASWPTLVRCRGCGFMYLSPRPTSAALASLYSRSYFENSESQQLGYDNYVADRELVERTFRRRLAEIEKRLLPERGRVLDVGCATGFFLSVARVRGWQALGVELSEWAAGFARRELGLDVRQGLLAQVADLPRDLDLVTMWDYIEHSTEPDRDLASAYRVLRPGGAIALTTPDVNSLPARVFGAKWMGFKGDEHLYYFSTANLCALLEKQGFKVRWARHVGKYVSLEFFAKRAHMYVPTVGHWMDLASRALKVSDRALHVNPFDIVMVVATK